MSYTSIEDDYYDALDKARRALSALSFAKHSPDKVRGLSGWVFEQVLLSRLLKALRKKGLRPEVMYQVPIIGRATVDLVIGSVAIEAKVSGTYDDSRTKYRKYRKAIEKREWDYLYVTLEETHEPNVRAAQEVFGKDRAFFLDRPGHWNKLITTITILERKQIAGGSRRH